ncbi:hypothetical protein TNIN_387161, partial [Trichonephila inaurata madagascariensis]
CFILNGTKRIAQCDCRNGFIQPKQIYSATTTIQVLFGNREKLSNDELAARGDVKQNVVHEGVLRFQAKKPPPVALLCKRAFFSRNFMESPASAWQHKRVGKRFQDTGCLFRNKSPGRKTKPVIEENVIRFAGPSKSTRRCGCRTGCPHHNGVACLRKRLNSRWSRF